MYEWIDAMVPYYSTTDCAHLNARGKRDRWGEPDSDKLAPWAVAYARTFARSCASCHGAFKPDEAGFVPRSRGRLEYETLLKSRAQP